MQSAIAPRSPPPRTPAAIEGGPYRVMIVDDSVVIRGVLRRSLEADPDITVTAAVMNGKQAVDGVVQSAAEVLVLDIEMPVMDGLTALPLLLRADPRLKVIVASTLTGRNADISLRCLRAGATDYLLKPGASTMVSADAFKAELTAKVKALGRAARRTIGNAAPPRAPRLAAVPAVLRPAAASPAPQALAIGSSTGGPQALFQVLGDLRPLLARLPVFVTQHMPATFTTILAEHLSRALAIDAVEAKEGDAVRPGRVYIAPGGFHMLVEPAAGRADGTKLIRLSGEAPENFCRPSVDPMLRSLVRAYGARLATLILTGMGQDGLEGVRAAAAAGGTVVAQDEASSVVWGMPGAVANAGLAHAILPLDRIGAHVVGLAP